MALAGGRTASPLGRITAGMAGMPRGGVRASGLSAEWTAPATAGKLCAVPTVEAKRPRNYSGPFCSGDVLLSHNLSSHYHRGCSVSLPCSEWERVGPLRYDHQRRRLMVESGWLRATNPTAQRSSLTISVAKISKELFQIVKFSNLNLQFHRFFDVYIQEVFRI